MAEPSGDITGSTETLKKLVDAAAGVIAGSGNLIGMRKAMEYVGFSIEQQKSIVGTYDQEITFT